VRLCPSDSLRRELVVGAGGNAEGAVEQADEQLRLPPARIEAEDELVQVALQVLGNARLAEKCILAMLWYPWAWAFG
jgi:hypothetical protein